MWVFRALREGEEPPWPDDFDPKFVATMKSMGHVYPPCDCTGRSTQKVWKMLQETPEIIDPRLMGSLRAYYYRPDQPDPPIMFPVDEDILEILSHPDNFEAHQAMWEAYPEKRRAAIKEVILLRLQSAGLVTHGISIRAAFLTDKGREHVKARRRLLQDALSPTDSQAPEEHA